MDSEPMPLQRISSNVPGLDAVLKGGFFRGGIYLLVGNPGAGKTILANQFAFNHVAAGGRTLYVTLLAESHARLFSSLEQMEFFDPKQLGNSMSYLSGYQVLEGEKLDGLLKLLGKAVRDHKATLLVIDGLVTVSQIMPSARWWMGSWSFPLIELECEPYAKSRYSSCAGATPFWARTPSKSPTQAFLSIPGRRPGWVPGRRRPRAASCLTSESRAWTRCSLAGCSRGQRHCCLARRAPARHCLACILSVPVHRKRNRGFTSASSRRPPGLSAKRSTSR